MMWPPPKGGNVRHGRSILPDAPTPCARGRSAAPARGAAYRRGFAASALAHGGRVTSEQAVQLGRTTDESAKMNTEINDAYYTELEYLQIALTLARWAAFLAAQKAPDPDHARSIQEIRDLLDQAINETDELVRPF